MNMAANDDDCVKRIVKVYLHFKGEASTGMLAKHLLDVDYGLVKSYTPRVLGQKMKQWSNPKNGRWFRPVPIIKKDETWWRLE